MNDITEQIEVVRENIKKACEKSGRDESQVTLIAVSKTKPWECITDAMEGGQYEFGENYVQELVEKLKQADTLSDEEKSKIKWHMIGHLQRNKVKYIIGKTKMIHSVDSLRLAEQISHDSIKANITTDILLEVNVAKEESKWGFMPELLEEAVQEIATYSNVRIRGLMTSAPIVDDPEKNRPVFAELKQLMEHMNQLNIPGLHMDSLSMGMTNDYIVAVEEGATLVRVGTAIFGHRNYAIGQNVQI